MGKKKSLLNVDSPDIKVDYKHGHFPLFTFGTTPVFPFVRLLSRDLTAFLCPSL